MAQLACTKDMLAELAVSLETPNVTLHPIAYWHAHCVQILGKNCVLIVNDSTRFGIFFPDVSKVDFATFPSLFVNRLTQELDWLDLTPGQIAKAKLALGPMCFMPSHDRSVLATMNDMLREIKTLAEGIGRLPQSEHELWGVSLRINRLLRRSKTRQDYYSPINELLELLKNQDNWLSASSLP